MARSKPSRNGQETGESAARWAQTVKERSTRAHGRRTLVKLLDAAVAEFAAHGWHGARMARLAKRAGTAHGTVYAYFADKDDLLYALSQDVGSELRTAMCAMPPLEPGAEGFEVLRSWLANVCQCFQRHAPIFQAVAEALADEDNTRAGRAAMRDQRRALAIFTDRIRATGTTGVDPSMAALCIYAMLEGANELVQRGELMVSSEELVAGLAEFVHRSIFGVQAVLPTKS